MPSKELNEPDVTEALLAIEGLDGDPTFGVNLERIIHHEELGWVIFEFLKFGDPPDYYWRDHDSFSIHDSNPNKYWSDNGRKFVRLWRIAEELNGVLYLVNYSVYEEDSQSSVPDGHRNVGVIRENEETGEHDEVYYYIAKDIGVHVMEVKDIDLSAEFDDEDASPIELEPIDGSENGMDWEDFTEWFQRLNKESQGDPREI